jgi:hypothetical protein
MSYPFQPHFVHQWLDVRDKGPLPPIIWDKDLEWLEGQVIDIKVVYGVEQLYIHYAGWHPKYDEWISVPNPRIAPFRSRTKCLPIQRKRPRLRVGKTIYVYDCDAYNTKRKARVKEIRVIINSCLKLIRVEFDGFDEEADGYFYSDSERLAPYSKVIERETEKEAEKEQKIALSPR